MRLQSYSLKDMNSTIILSGFGSGAHVIYAVFIHCSDIYIHKDCKHQQNTRIWSRRIAHYLDSVNHDALRVAISIQTCTEVYLNLNQLGMHETLSKCHYYHLTNEFA